MPVDLSTIQFGKVQVQRALPAPLRCVPCLDRTRAGCSRTRRQLQPKYCALDRVDRSVGVSVGSTDNRNGVFLQSRASTRCARFRFNAHESHVALPVVCSREWGVDWFETHLRAEKRKGEAARIRDKYPDRIPVRRRPSWPHSQLGRCVMPRVGHRREVREKRRARHR